MKRLIAVAVFFLTVIFFNSFANDQSGTITNIQIQPTLSNIGGYNGYVFAKLSNGTYFYVAPTDVTYEVEMAMLLTAKYKGAVIYIGVANGSNGSPQGVNITLGSITYYQLYYMTWQ